MSVPDEMKIQLELRDRLNYPVVLQSSLTMLESAYASKDFDLGVVQNLIYGIYKKIPSSWYDEKFRTRVKKVFSEIEIENRPMFGGVHISKALCLKMGIKVTKKVQIIDYFDLLNAVIDLLDRKGMLVSRKKIEIATGRNLEQGESPLSEFHDMKLSDIEKLESGETLDDMADKNIEKMKTEETTPEVIEDEWNYEPPKTPEKIKPDVIEDEWSYN